MECTCSICQGYCNHRPGRFAPGQIEIAAKHLGMTTQEFFNKHCVVDEWQYFGDNMDHVSYILPAYDLDQSVREVYKRLKIGGEENIAGKRTMHDTGPCRFFKNGRCSIHAVKPAECANVDHSTESGEHVRITALWNKKKHQNQIKKLLEGTFND